MLSPPEVAKPFASTTERAAARAEFVRLGRLVEQVVAAADGSPLPAWLETELARPLPGSRERPGVRLQRYRSVFAEELTALQEALVAERLRALDDATLRTGRYLAQRLLASLLDCSLEQLRSRLPEH